jgi:hypothetical protein
MVLCTCMSSTKQKTTLDNQHEDRDCIAGNQNTKSDRNPSLLYEIKLSERWSRSSHCGVVYVRTSYKVLMAALQLLMVERFRIYRSKIRTCSSLFLITVAFVFTLCLLMLSVFELYLISLTTAPV